MKNRTIAYLLSALLVFGAVGCSSPKEETKETTSQVSKQEEAKKPEEPKQEDKKAQESSTYEDVNVEQREQVADKAEANVITHSNLVENGVTKVTDESKKQTSKRMMKATVVANTDGDTLKVKLENGKTESVRFLLVDTPETRHPKMGVQPFGPEASAFTKKYAPIGKQIELEFDVSEREKYGRLLAYVWVDGQMLNRMLVEQGLARVAYIYAPNTKYVDYLKEEQTKAQQAKRGIWSVEDYATDNGFVASKVPKPAPKAAPVQAPATTQPASEPQPQPQPKTENKPSENQPTQKLNFASCKEAKAAGYSNITRESPAYSEKLDRDKDGIACDK
ncbi:endonuclease YokF [Bacillus luti]|nr:SPBc2 prophage-derived endonuclease YokF [Bacillus cereus]